MERSRFEFMVYMCFHTLSHLSKCFLSWVSTVSIHNHVGLNVCLYECLM